METVGAYLKKERESKNISLGELSRLTKISELYLEYIENDEFEKLPQGPYIKGYIASYSRLIEGNVDEALKLYEILNRKQTQTENIQPEIAKQIVKKNLPEKPKPKVRKKPKDAPLGNVKSLFDKVASSVRVTSAPFKTAGTRIKTIGSSIRKGSNGLDIIVSYAKRMASSRSWLYAFIALIVTGILVLAGFGFYHLFIYEPHPLSVSEGQPVQDRQTHPTPAIDPEKSRLPSTTTDTALSAEQREGKTGSKQSTTQVAQRNDQERSSTSSTDADAAAPREKPIPEKSSVTPVPAVQPSTSLSGLPSTAENAASAQSADGKKSSLPLDQGQTATKPPPELEPTDLPLRVLRASICSAIKDRMPAGVDTSFPISAQQVFVWSEIEAQQIPTKIRHIYYFKEEKVSDVTLDVGSAYWRTWSSKSISEDSDRGEWRVDIASSEGNVLRRLYFEVR